MNKVPHGVLNEGSIFNYAVASYKFNLDVNAQFSFLDIALLYTEFWIAVTFFFKKPLSLVNLSTLSLWSSSLYVPRCQGFG